MAEKLKKRVWDLPLRIFHWALVILVSISIYTGNNGGFEEMDYHMLSGYSILALIGFRLLWGLFGSHYARFSSFVQPGSLFSYARRLFDREQPASLGHNPLGGLSTLVFILVLGIQAGTGLFANDDIMLEGPLVHLVSDDTSSTLTTIHHYSAKALYVLLALHLIAIAFYEHFKKQRLILAMITGRKVTGTKGASKEADGDATIRQLAAHEINPIREISSAVALMSVCGACVYWLVNYL